MGKIGVLDEAEQTDESGIYWRVDEDLERAFREIFPSAEWCASKSAWLVSVKVFLEWCLLNFERGPKMKLLEAIKAAWSEPLANPEH